MKSIKRVLATVLMLAMVFTLLGGTFSVSAASDVTCTSKVIVVDDDFAAAAKGATVSATVAGIKYTGTMGTTAFATIQEAYAAMESKGSIYVAAGVYAGNLVLDKSVALYGNGKDVNPNDPYDLSVASDKRGVTGKEESILQDVVIYNKAKALDEVLINAAEITINGFAFAGDSAIYLTKDRVNGAIIHVSNNVFDLINENSYNNIGVSGDFNAIKIGDAVTSTCMPNEVVITNNRIEGVNYTGGGIPVCHGIATSFVTKLTVQGNYVANTTSDVVDISHLQSITKVTGNYFKNALRARVYDGIQGKVEISDNIFDTIGGTNATGQYALGVYAGAESASISNEWRDNAEEVLVCNNTFKNVGKAIMLYGRMRVNNAATNGSAYGTKICENVFVPVNADDCTFVHLKWADGQYNPKVYDNYTGGRNTKDICMYEECGVSGGLDYGAYWLNTEKTHSSDLLKVKAITNNAGVSFATAKVLCSPDYTITATVPAALDQIQIGLEVGEGAYYELYTDAECTTFLPDETVTLEEGKSSQVYAKVCYGTYYAVYSVYLTRKTMYSDYLAPTEYVVSPEFAQYPHGQTVYVEVEGQWRRAQVGHSAYKDVGLALDKVAAGNIIHITAGVTANGFTLNKGIILKGAKAGINPNVEGDYAQNPDRMNESEETIFTDEIFLAAGINGLVLDGIMTSHKGRFHFNTGFSYKGLEFRNMILSANDHEDSFVRHYRDDSGRQTGNKVVIYQCRFAGAGQNYIMRWPNIADAIIEKNVFCNSARNLYMGGMDGSSTDEVIFRDNIFYNISAGNFICIGQQYNANDVGARVKNSYRFENNRFINCSGDNIIRIDRWTSGNRLTMTGNRFEGTSKGSIYINPEEGHSGYTININENYFEGAAVNILTNRTGSPADCSRNYAAAGATTVYGAGAKYAPYYADAAMTQLIGDYQITGIKAPFNAVLDAENKTISYNGDATLDEVKFDLTVSTGASYELYADEQLTEKLDNNTVVLKGQNTTAYVKTISPDGSSYYVYTINITKPANSMAELKGLDIEGSTWVDKGDNEFQSNIPNSYVAGPITPLVSSGATAFLYNGDDTEMKNPIAYVLDINIPAKKTNYLVKVVSEDGSTTKVYKLAIVRGKSAACDLVKFGGTKKVTTIEGNKASITFDYDVTKMLPELVVSGGATYEFYKDPGAVQHQDEAIDLAVGENKLYVKITAEDGTTYKIYELCITREDKSAAKRILGTSFPEFATTQGELNNDAEGILLGLKRVDNAHYKVELEPREFIESIVDSIVVSEGATYEVFTGYDYENDQPAGAAISTNANKKDIQLKEGTNVFYVRVNALNGSAAVYELYIYNKVKSTENKILGINGFNISRQGNLITGTCDTANPQIGIFISDDATAKVYADRKKTVLVDSTIGTLAESETKQEFNACKITDAMAQGYVRLYVDVTSHAGTTASYELKLTAGNYINTFTDIEKHWAETYIQQAYLMGVTNGYADAEGTTYTFKPDNYATRQEISVFICNLLGIDASAYASQKLPYKDAGKVAQWASGAVKAVTATGIMNGDGANFNPNSNITRQEFMTVIVRAAALDTSKSTAAAIQRFKDKDQIAPWAKVFVQTAVEFDLVNGDDQNRINPNKPITRAEIVKIMVCAKDYVR